MGDKEVKIQGFVTPENEKEIVLKEPESFEKIFETEVEDDD